MSRLELRGLRKRYGATTALDGIDLDVESGSRAAIVGPSGSGKSTLLRVIAGYEALDGGRIMLDGEVLADGGRFVPPHLRHIGIVSQDGALFPHLTVADNIAFGLARRDPGRERRIAELMAMVELEPALRDRRPDQISGGQQQRVALARALARRPRLMLLDEPFSALDTSLRTETRQAVATLLGEAGVTTVLVTHDRAEALSFADQVAVISKGRLLQAGAPLELYLRPSSAMIARFLGDAIILPAVATGGVADCALGRLTPGEPVDDGPVEVLIRPEQIVLSAADADGVAVLARIVFVEFAGQVCSLQLELLAANQQRLSFPVARQGTPLAVGAIVRIDVTGPVHAMRGPDKAGD